MGTCVGWGSGGGVGVAELPHALSKSDTNMAIENKKRVLCKRNMCFLFLME